MASSAELGRKMRVTDVSERLSRRPNHLERERAVILNHAAKEKHFYHKSLQDLKTVKSSPSHLSTMGSPLLVHSESTNRVQTAATASPSRPFSRHFVKSEPDRARVPRRLAPLAGDVVPNRSHAELQPGMHRSASEKSIPAHVLVAGSPETFRSKSPAFRRKIVAANGNIKAIVDLLPSLKRDDDPFGSEEEKKPEKSPDFAENHGMSERLSKAVKEIENELAAHGMSLDDVSLKPEIPERPSNLELPDKTKKYHTFSSLPPQVPIPWHLYGQLDDEEEEDDEDGGGDLKLRVPSSRLPSAKPRKKSALRRDDIPVSKTLEQEFKELKNCRYLRKYKPTTKRESWF